MNSSATVSIVLILLGLSVGQAQNVNLNCFFTLTANVYTCQLTSITISDNESANIIIGGTHMQGYSNAAVRRVNILNSNIPFIIRQLFTTFVNLETLVINNGGLTRIQSNAFTGARNLSDAIISNNVLLQRIEPDAFSGASNLFFLDMFQNGLHTVHESGFTGLSQLSFLNIDFNQIAVLPVDVFQPLVGLTSLSLDTNMLVSLDGRLFQNNRQLHTINLDGNQINAIGRSIFDNLNQVNFFSILRNQCANNVWRVGGGVTTDTIRSGLNICFNNFVEGPEPKRFVLELHGFLIIRNENGTEVGRL